MKTSRKKFIRNVLLGAAGWPAATAADRLHRAIFACDRVNRARFTDRSPAAVPRPVSIFSKHLQWLDYHDMAALAAELGFDGVDVTVRPGGHVVPERVRDDLPEAVEAVRNAGLEVYTISTAITDPDDPYTETLLATAGHLQIPNYRLGWLEYDETVSVPRNLERFTDRLGRLAEMNRHYSVHGDVQNHAGTSLGSSIWDLWLVLREIDSPWLGCQFDIRHATVEGANSWKNDLRAITPYIGTLDIKDFIWERRARRWEVANVPLGEGMVDFKAYFDLLDQHEIAVPMTLHFEYPIGGAEHGSASLETDEQQVIRHFAEDLHTLRGWLRDDHSE